VLRVGSLASLGVAVSLLGACKPLSGPECDGLFDRYAELLLRADRPETEGRERLELRARALQAAHQDPHFGTCSRDVSRRQYECAMAAADVDTFERCLM